MSETFSAPGGSATIERQQQEQLTEPGDHERFSHYAPKAKIMEAMVNGTPIVALCGKVWVPSRDPQKFPVCPACREIYESMPEGPQEPDDQ
ncbi:MULTISPECIES: DUF3039 domain-containing protein [Brevibacterium]|uniref:DUF3039 domain-containing protein n=1 Tax=Brevibacterium TaxID=1696 RepID=UPI000306F3A4|nr:MULTISPECIES: DUF3039 domain-containing protein [Brevibacterium]OFL67270.1 hypothetical protein HMPREF2757_11260 [Brevibacterium sp. HMSC063G07]OFS26018.1 hypothetical protein HMPREF3162_07060 [Brevibacterium sp. HMSC07C04]